MVRGSISGLVRSKTEKWSPLGTPCKQGWLVRFQHNVTGWGIVFVCGMPDGTVTVLQTYKPRSLNQSLDTTM